MTFRIRDHLALSNVCLRHPEPADLTSCKCKCPTFYLVWRIFWAIYHSSWLIANLVNASQRGGGEGVSKWFIYLSNWMYLVLTLHSLLDAVLVFRANCAKRVALSRDSRLPWYLQLSWLLYNLMVTGGIMICLWYWSMVHRGREITAIRFNTHAVAALYVLLNIIVTKHPMRLLHFVYPVTFGLLYTGFSVIYYAAGGTTYSGKTRIYSVLDWNKPGRTMAISSLSNFIFIPIVHVSLWALSLLLQRAHERLRNRNLVYDNGLTFSQKIDDVGSDDDIEKS
ncbi:protein rolling stone [Aplysia californica]|uniref:Protein rolling stone n=1 Tax=Aplysia californica TaxID=6500 RepID=A0ABM0JAM1_APLCA|nr:protein rolling stone [Aplysia californica]